MHITILIGVIVIVSVIVNVGFLTLKLSLCSLLFLLFGILLLTIIIARIIIWPSFRLSHGRFFTNKYPLETWFGNLHLRVAGWFSYQGIQNRVAQILGHFQVGSSRYRSLIDGVSTLQKPYRSPRYPKLPTCSFL